MIDELKLRRDEVRGSRAKSLLEDELLNEALAALEKTYADALFLTTPGDDKAREKLYLAVNIVRKIKDQLGAILNDGVLAQHHLRDLAGPEQKPFHQI